jgi:domain of unknown function (DUF1704)
LNCNLFALSNYNYQQDKSAREDHIRLNNVLCGQPDRHVFESILEEKRTGIADKEIFKPKQEICQQFAAIMSGRLSDMLSAVPDAKKRFSIEEAAEIFRYIITEVLDISEQGWIVEIQKGGTNASVIPSKKIIRLPEKRNRGEFTNIDLRLLIVHEIGVHVTRSISLPDVPLRALHTGLPGYEIFEERLAKIVEQGVCGEYIHLGYMRYLSIGFGFFYDMPFREIYETQLELWGKDDVTKSVVFDSVQRALRGTGEFPNCKDLAYYNGYDKAWSFIESNIHNPRIIE